MGFPIDEKATMVMHPIGLPVARVTQPARRLDPFMDQVTKTINQDP